MSETKEKDKFELFLDEMLLKLQECQKEHAQESCSTCSEYLTCKLRDEYVEAVYNSMSKGVTGGFEF